MHRKNFVAVMFVMLVLLFLACGSRENSMAENVIETSEWQETKQSLTLDVLIGENTYTLQLEDNATVKELVKRMPMELVMNELNGNEKFYNLPEALPTDSQKVGMVHAGELMLYGSDCLVLFYEDFQSSYSYTRLGYLKNATGISAAVGDGYVKVNFATGKWGLLF